jgi:hypothetical protein
MVTVQTDPPTTTSTTINLLINIKAFLYNDEDDLVATLVMEAIPPPTPAVIDMDMVTAAVGQEMIDHDEHDRYGYHHYPNTRTLTKLSFNHV